MIDKWQNQNIDLNQLANGIMKFFNQDEYEARLNQKKNNYKIEAQTKNPATPLKIQVNIYGKPDNFTIEFTTNKTKKRGLSGKILLGYIATAVGAGRALNYELQNQEHIDKTEKTFWDHVDKQISQLANSNRDKTPKTTE